MTLEECHNLVDTVKRTGLTYMQAETGCFHAPTLSAREMRMKGEFGTIYFTQGEYLHDVGDSHPGGAKSGLLTDPEGKRTWRYGFPPANYPTHATGPVIFATGERMTAVACLGYRPPEDPYPGNVYHNPFGNVTFLSKTSGGNASRIAIHHSFGGRGDIAERAEYWGTKMVFMEPRFGQPALISRQNTAFEPWPVNDHTDILPPALRRYIKVGHGGSEVFITNEFVTAMVEGRRPLVDVFEGVAYVAPGICAHQSALHDGEWVKVPDFGWHS
jgi:predicted dehydrogenase